jgi:hypothetical protein
VAAIPSLAAGFKLVRPYKANDFGPLRVTVRAIRDGAARHLEHLAFDPAVKLIDGSEKAINEGGARREINVLGRAHLLNSSMVHHHDVVGKLERFFLVVGNENGRDMEFIVQRSQPATQFFAHLRIERTERLVEQQHAGFDRERACERDALALPARELRRQTRCERRELDELEQGMHLSADIVLARTMPAWLAAQSKRNVLEYAHVSKQRVVLKNESNLALLRRS